MLASTSVSKTHKDFIQESSEEGLIEEQNVKVVNYF